MANLSTNSSHMPQKVRTKGAKAEATIGQKTLLINEGSPFYRTKINIDYQKTCKCNKNHLNCLSPKEWLKNQLGVWRFFYESRDIRDKKPIPPLFQFLCQKELLNYLPMKVNSFSIPLLEVARLWLRLEI